MWAQVSVFFKGDAFRFVVTVVCVYSLRSLKTQALKSEDQTPLPNQGNQNNISRAYHLFASCFHCISFLQNFLSFLQTWIDI